MDEPSWRLFDRVADDYDEAVVFFAESGRAIVASLDPEPGCRLLDLGAGLHDRVLGLPADDRILRRATGVWSGRKPHGGEQGLT